MTICLKITKLAKRLKSFTLDDLLIMFEEKEEDVIKSIESLLDSNIIRRTDESSYIYVENNNRFKSKNSESVKPCICRVIFSEEEMEKLLWEKENLKEYENAPKFIKRKVDKYLLLLKEANGLTGRVLDNHINNVWNVKNPEMKTSKTCFIRAKKIMKEFGLAGLIPTNLKFSRQSSAFNEDIYKGFRKYLIENKGKSIKFLYNKYKMAFLAKNPEMESWEFPSYGAITIRIKKDIHKFNDSEMAELFAERKMVEKITIKKFGFTTLKPAAEDLLKDLIEQNHLKPTSIKKYRYAINSLIEFFDNKKLDEIKQKDINKYKMALLEDHKTEIAIDEYIRILNKILYIYMPEEVSCLLVSKEFYSKDFRVLSDQEIRNLLEISRNENPKMHSILSLILLTGLTRGEVLALKWDNIDLFDKQIQVFGSMYKSEIKPHKNTCARRTIAINDKTAGLLDDLRHNWQNNKLDLLFVDSNNNPIDPNGDFQQEFVEICKKARMKKLKLMDLRDTFTCMLVSKGVSLTFVAQYLGYSSVNTLITKFESYIPSIDINKHSLI